MGAMVRLLCHLNLLSPGKQPWRGVVSMVHTFFPFHFVSEMNVVIEMRLDKSSLGQSVQLHSPAGGHT